MTIPQSTPTPSPEQEEWRPVVGYEGLYEVSSLGRVRRVGGTHGARTSRILRGYCKAGDYRRVSLSSGTGTRTHLVHLLVAVAFLGPCRPGKEVNHRDLDRTNCALANLEYLTRSENKLHGMRAGNGKPPLSDDDVREIRRSPLSSRVIAKVYGVQHSYIRQIRRRCWRRDVA